MTGVYIAMGIVALALFFYLIVAMVNPEIFP